MSRKVLDVKSAAVQERIRSVIKRLDPTTRNVVKRTVVQVEGDVVRGSFTGYVAPGRSIGKLRSRSGMLKRSINHRLEGRKLAELVGAVGSTSPYSPAHEFGRGPTSSKRGKKFYPIPTKHALTAAGVLRKRITDYDKKKHFFLWIGGRLKFARRVGRGKSAKLRVLFNLYRFPTSPIRPRLGIRDAMQKRLPEHQAALGAIVRGLFG